VSFGGDLTPRWRPITKRALDLFGRWGDPRTNLRSMLDSVLPVQIVDRFRDDDEGSLYGLTAFVSNAFPGQFPSVSFGSAVNDWELLCIAEITPVFSTGALLGSGFHIFTPIEPYNPAVNLSPVGFFRAGLLTNRAFTFGTVSGIGGYNPVLPAIFGAQCGGKFQMGNGSGIFFSWQDYGHLDSPIRVYRDVTLTVQFLGPLAPGTTGFTCGIIYRERPKVSA